MFPDLTFGCCNCQRLPTLLPALLIITCYNSARSYNKAGSDSSPLSDQHQLFSSRTRTKFADRAFSVAGPVVWNIIPAAVREADTVNSLFSMCFDDVWFWLL